ncbi:MAG: Spy/CpxP family protein refolding chaperone [bacterium]
MKTFLKFALVFVVGLFLGSIASVIYINHCMSHLWMNSGDHRHILAHLSQELNLTADQKTKVEAILKLEDAEVSQLCVQGRDQYRAIRDKIDAQIRPLLTPAQIKKLNALQERREHPPTHPGLLGYLFRLFHPMPPPNAMTPTPLPTK